MADVHTKKQRSYNMSCIKSESKQEIIFRKMLWHEGFRYRVNKKIQKTKPDILLPKYNAAIFYHGCFFHFHECKHFKMPSKDSKTDWATKLAKNHERDQRDIRTLRNAGWRVLIVWECSWRWKGRGRKSQAECLEKVVERTIAWIRSTSKQKTIEE